VLSFHDHRHCP
jgi:hypothetical protein